MFPSRNLWIFNFPKASQRQQKSQKFFASFDATQKRPRLSLFERKVDSPGPAETTGNGSGPSASRFKSTVEAGTRIPSDEFTFFQDAGNCHVITGRVLSSSGAESCLREKKAEGVASPRWPPGFTTRDEGKQEKTRQTLRKKTDQRLSE